MCKAFLIFILLLFAAAPAHAQNYTPLAGQQLLFSQTPVWLATFDKIRPLSGATTCTDCGSMWIQFDGYFVPYDDDGYLAANIRDFSNSTTKGASLGWHRYFGDSLQLGAFGQFDIGRKKDLAVDQYRNSYKLGVYGGFFTDRFEIKGTVAGGYHKWGDDDSRVVIHGASIEGDVEAAYKIPLRHDDVFVLKPFVGADFMFSRINTESRHLNTTDMRAGLKLDGTTDRLYWYGQAYGKTNLTGRKVDVSTAIEKAKLDRYAIGFGGGASYRVGKTISLLINYNGEVGKEYSDAHHVSAGLAFDLPCGSCAARKAKPTSHTAAVSTGNPAPVSSALNEKRTVYVLSDESSVDGSALFAFNQAELSASAAKTIKAIAAAERNTGNRLSIEGHADKKGYADYNHQLSARRAKAVYDALRKEGISQNRMSWEGFGSTKPVDTTGSPEGDARNRRVEIVVYK